MKLSQNWVGYLDRSYEQIKRSLIKRLSIVAPEITDHTETNPLIIIVSMFSGVGEMLNLYIDSIAREAFLGTARRFSSVVKLTKLIDYNIKARNSSGVNLLFYLVDNSDEPVNYPSGTLVIPKGTIIYPTNSNMPFVLLHDVKIPTGSQNAYGAASQYEDILGDLMGNTSGAVSEKFDLSDKYVNNSLILTINGETWYQYNSVGLMGPNTKGFIVGIDELGKAYFQFGDGANGKIPATGMAIYADYKECEGKLGNLPPNSFGTISISIPTPLGINLKVDNPDYCSAGTNFEDIADVKDRAARSIRTLERAVTYQDYLDLCYMVLGVGAAEIKYCCGKYVDVFIVPNSPGIATISLLQQVQSYLDCRVMITTIPVVNAAGITKIWVKANVYAKPLFDPVRVKNDVIAAADAEFGYGNLKINRKVAVSDITYIWEKLESVDRVEIVQVKIIPFARQIEKTISILNIAFLSLPNTTVKAVYTVIYNNGANTFEVFKNGFFLTSLPVNTNYADGSIIAFKILPGIYLNGDKWEFTVFPSYPEIFPDNLITIDDYSASIMEVSPFVGPTSPRTIYSDIEIISQGSSSSCLPPCQ